MTTSATGDRGGFTLIELLLAIALIALLSTIFITGTNSLLSDKAPSPDEQFWRACARARKEALEGQRSVMLTYDPKVRAFLLNDGSQRTALPVTGTDDLVIDFHPAEGDASSSVLVGGTLVETTPLASVTFYGDGTCTPFRVQIRTLAGAHMLSIDPWTCAPVLAKSDAAP
jgi:prepilin-type N-terminal cleavage/methylation domain-containing protein